MVARWKQPTGEKLLNFAIESSHNNLSSCWAILACYAVERLIQWKWNIIYCFLNKLHSIWVRGYRSGWSIKYEYQIYGAHFTLKLNTTTRNNISTLYDFYWVDTSGPHLIKLRCQPQGKCLTFSEQRSLIKTAAYQFRLVEASREFSHKLLL